MKGKNKLAFFDKLVLWINGALWIALLISYLAPYIDPRKAWVFAFFGLAYPFLMITNLGFLVYWLLRNKWVALVSLLMIALGWDVLSNNVEIHSPNYYSYASNANTVRMMTYNVHNFKRYGSANDTSTKHEILQIISDQRPDVIGIQEFYTRNRGTYDMRDSIVKIMGAEYFYFEPVIFNYQESIGVAVFSRFPIIAHGMVPFTDKASENSCIYIDVQKQGRKFRVYSVHLQSIRFDPEDYKYINRITEGKTDVTSARRLGSKLRAAFLKRSGQVDKIREHAAKCPYPYIISGDFNDTPSSYAVHQMAKGIKNAFREKGSGLGRTYNGNFPNYQIDYIMASPQFDVSSYRIIEKKLSDHYPVCSDLLLK